MICQYFLLFHWLPFCYVDCFLWQAKVVWCSSSCPFYIFCCLCFRCHVKKTSPNPMSWSCFPLFSSRSSIVLDLMFRSLVYFEVIFVYNVKQGFNFSLLHVNIQFSQHHLLSRLLFPHFVILAPLSKPFGHICSLFCSSCLYI